MKNSKLIQVLRTFNSKELKSFSDFVVSPFFNKNKKVLPLLAHLQKVLKTPSNQAFEKQIVFQKSYPKRTYDENYLRKQTSILYQLLKNYLTQIEWSKSSFKNEHAQLRQLAERKLDHIFQLQLQSLSDNISSKPLQDSQYYYQQFLINSESDAFFNRMQKRRFDASIQKKMNHLDTYYLIEKLKGSCEMLNREKIVEGSYELNLIQEIKQFLSAENTLSEIPIIKIYLQILKTLQKEEDESHFEKLVILLNQYQKKLPQEEVIGMYRYAQNYCIRRINRGQKEYFRKLFNLFQTQLENKINFRNNILSAEDYKNIVTVGLKVKEAKWVKDFIFNYKNFLLPEIRENVFNYNLASFYYGVQDYDSAIQLLNTVQYSDIYYEISGKIILTKIYFILEEHEPLYYLIDAFKLNLLRNKKIAATYRQSIINFLIQLKKVTRLKSNQPYLEKTIFEKKFEQVQNRIQEIELILDRRWLLNQLEK